MLMQTTLAHFRGMKINVLGTMYEVGQDLCVELPDDAPESLVDRFSTMAFVPMDEVQAQKNAQRRRAAEAKTLKKGYEATREFVQLVKASPEVLATVNKAATFKEFQEIAQGYGYAITREHYNRAVKEADGPAPTQQREADLDEVRTPFGTYRASDLAAVAAEAGMSVREAFCSIFHVKDGGQDAHDGLMERSTLKLLLAPPAPKAKKPSAEPAPKAEEKPKAKPAKKSLFKKKAAKKSTDD